MSEETFTKGPWETTDGPYIVPSTGEGECFSNGDWAIYPPLGESGPVAFTCSLENAQLIATAPELYAALANTLCLAELKWGNLDADANKVFAAARAALARADGKQA